MRSILEYFRHFLNNTHDVWEEWTVISCWHLASQVPDSNTWWRNQMETFSALLALCAGNSPVTGEFPAQRAVMRSFDVFFDLRLNERLSKQWCDWWFKTQSRPLWRHSNGIRTSKLCIIVRYRPCWTRRHGEDCTEKKRNFSAFFNYQGFHIPFRLPVVIFENSRRDLSKYRSSSSVKKCHQSSPLRRIATSRQTSFHNHIFLKFRD